MAPSPTGNLHLGTAYTTLFNYLFARKNEGKFILRFEDTDKERSKSEFEENILNGLKWLKLNFDEGPFRQSDRLQIYQKYSKKLLDEGKAYYCFCTPEELDEVRKRKQQEGKPLVYSGKCRNFTSDEVSKNLEEKKPYAIRFRMPEERGKIEFNDLLHGKTSFEADLLGDMVIMRLSGIPLYNFAVVVDDIDMKITHVLRGEDHLSNTPKQIVLFEAFGVRLPEFAHWPSILNPSRIGKLSKRENATSVYDYRLDGYLPEATVNYLALLGWTMPEGKEIMTLPEMEKSFDLKKMRLSGAAFDLVKLEWINGEYIRKFSDEELYERLLGYLFSLPHKDSYKGEEGKVKQLVPLIKERIKKLSDFIPLTDFLFEKPEYDAEVFKKVIKDKEINVISILQSMVIVMEKLERPWDGEEFERVFRQFGERNNLSASEVFQLIRVAVSGQLVTPPLFESIKILGEEKTMSRVMEAKKFLG